jgi:hypothetical protein
VAHRRVGESLVAPQRFDGPSTWMCTSLSTTSRPKTADEILGGLSRLLQPDLRLNVNSPDPARLLSAAEMVDARCGAPGAP